MWKARFVEFMDRVPFYGAATACMDNAMLRAVLPRVHARVYTYGRERRMRIFGCVMLPEARAAMRGLR